MFHRTLRRMESSIRFREFAVRESEYYNCTVRRVGPNRAHTGSIMRVPRGDAKENE